MKTPKVSLIIPVYNFEKYIASTLESVFQQTYPNIEIIVVNDGSQDQSQQIVSDFQNSHDNLRLINQDNKGVSVARNTGIEATNGEYILFSDADDLLNPDYVLYLVKNAIEYDADISIGTGIYTNYKIGNLNADKSDECIAVLSKEEALMKMLTYWYPIGCCCRAFRRVLFDKGLRFIPGQKVGEGFTFNINAIQLSDKIVVGNKPIYCYRRDNSDSCMTNFNIDRAREAVNSIQIIRSLFNSPSKEIAMALDFAEWHTKGDMYNWMALSDSGKIYPEEKTEYYKAIRFFAKKALTLKINKKEKLRAFLQALHPDLMVRLLKFRKNISMI